MSSLIYLAQPYSHPSEEIRYKRFDEAIEATAWLFRNGLFVFSPIIHSHPISTCAVVPTDWEYWAEMDTLMISRCDELYLLQLEGWDKSVGVKAELALCFETNKPVSLMVPKINDYEIKKVEMHDIWTANSESPQGE
jgi:hypothetical protein